MDCVACGSAAVTERPERTAQGYRRFRCRDCGKQYNERSGGLLNHTQYPSDVIALVVLWRLRYRLTLRDLAEMFLVRGIVFSYEAVREWEAKLAPLLADELRRRRHGKGGARGRHWRRRWTAGLCACPSGSAPASAVSVLLRSRGASSPLR
jgi:putative transposase